MAFSAPKFHSPEHGISSAEVKNAWQYLEGQCIHPYYTLTINA
jgi:hypothetical protein